MHVIRYGNKRYLCFVSWPIQVIHQSYRYLLAALACSCLCWVFVFSSGHITVVPTSVIKNPLVYVGPVVCRLAVMLVLMLPLVSH